MPRPYPPEFRARAVALVRAGRQAKQTAFELGIHPVTLSNWIRQDDIDQGRRPGRSELVPSHASWQWLRRTCHGNTGGARQQPHTACLTEPVSKFTLFGNDASLSRPEPPRRELSVPSGRLEQESPWPDLHPWAWQ
ncbi:transposase [Microbacterium gorillae]|uniref:transposase n=1 Tax=Microbacterium gorillae TaxID=1231063 RepID=UPI000BBEB0A1|nr:transposase [Microbacterium gorillae]